MRRRGFATRDVGRVILAWLWAAAVVVCSSHALAAEPAQRDLLHLLPQAPELSGWQPEGPSHQVAGEDLFSLIDGGAEVFLKAGFSRAMTQTYGRADRQPIQLEIYEMVSADAARAVFTQKTKGDGQPVTLGAQGVDGGYYS